MTALLLGADSLKQFNPMRSFLRFLDVDQFLPTGAAKTGTGVAVHENLLDSAMTAPLKRESLLERPNPMRSFLRWPECGSIVA